MANEKVDRNIQVYADRKAGMSYTELILKYRISMSQLQRIITREELREMKAKEQAQQDKKEQL